jgi:hypothetical protein
MFWRRVLLLVLGFAATLVSVWATQQQADHASDEVQDLRAHRGSDAVQITSRLPGVLAEHPAREAIEPPVPAVGWPTQSNNRKEPFPAAQGEREFDPLLASDQSVGSWLSQSEREGGHLLARHVGKSEAELRQRLAQDKGISAASTFATREEAIRAVKHVVQTNGQRIVKWRDHSSEERLVLRAPLVAGQVLERGAVAPVQGRKVNLVLQRPNWVLTGYPTL